MTTNIVRIPDIKIGDLLGLEKDDANMLVLDIKPTMAVPSFGSNVKKESCVEILFLNMKNQEKFQVKYKLSAKIIMYRHSTS